MEQYFNQYQTTVAVGGYTAASGVLNVAATSPITLNSGDSTRLLVYRIVASVFTPIVLLKVTVVNSSTQFAVAAEGSDANALAGDIVVNVATAGGMDQIRKDLHRQGVSGAFSSSVKIGDIWIPTDDSVRAIYDGSHFQPAYLGFPLMGNPNLQTWSWINQNSAVITARSSSLYLAGTASAGVNMQARVMTAPSTPYCIVATFIPLIPNTLFAHAGVLFSDGTKISEFDVISDSIVVISSGGNTSKISHLSGGHYTSATAFSAGLTLSWDNYITGGHPITFLLQDDGTNKKAGFSPDFGITIMQIYSESHTNFLTPTEVGFFYDANSANVAGGIVVLNWYVSSSTLF